MASFCLSSNRFTNGPKVRKFESKWSEWLGSKHSLYVSSGSTANYLLLSSVKELYGLKDGDKVLVQSRLIIPTNKYYIATNDYLLTGGDNMFFFDKNTKVYRFGYSLRDAFIDYTKSNLYLSSKIDNRFIKDE